MRVDFYGLMLETPRITVYLWSAWRASALEHRLFETIGAVPGMQMEASPDESRAHLTDPKSWRLVLQAISRVLKGWQEEADPGSERRSWRWILEGDSDHDGYDHNGEPVSLWGFLRLGVERGGPGEGDKGEDIDLEGFGVRFWPEQRQA
jgi:hypothetical protein